MPASTHHAADASAWLARFDATSPVYHAALSELRSVMLRVGFLVDKKRDTEATLRVYIRERLTYPLLNPSFVARRISGGRSRAFVEIRVLSKLTTLSNMHESLDRRLADYPSSALLSFEHSGEMERPYFFHGCFQLPLTLQSGSDATSLNLAALEPSLIELRRYLEPSRGKD